MASALLRTLGEIPLVDQHAHAVLRSHPATLDEFRGLFSESAFPTQWPHVETSLAYRRALPELAELLGCDATEEAVFARRLETDPDEYAAALIRPTTTGELFLDDGFPPAEAAFTPEEMSALAGCPVRPVLRIERVAEQALSETRDPGDLRERVRHEVATAPGRGYAGLKTIAAYRTGLDVIEPTAQAVREALGGSGPRLEAKPLVDFVLLAALEANEADPLPLQVHVGFGDADLRLAAANPALLQPVIERFPATPFVLLHCYPYIREAGWLVHVYPNAYFDLSLTIPHVARPVAMLEQALELAPASKLLYASDAARAPELYYLAARRWRAALADVLPRLVPGEEEPVATAILRENALRVYRA
jgi:hypothetical protein